MKTNKINTRTIPNVSIMFSYTQKKQHENISILQIKTIYCSYVQLLLLISLNVWIVNTKSNMARFSETNCIGSLSETWMRNAPAYFFFVQMHRELWTKWINAQNSGIEMACDYVFVFMFLRMRPCERVHNNDANVPRFCTKSEAKRNGALFLCCSSKN